MAAIGGLRAAAERASGAVRRLGRRKPRIRLVSLDLFSFGDSHIGLVRETNQDRFLCARAERLWVVADGMGGHERGERAAEILVEEIGRSELPQDLDPARTELAARIANANRLIFEEAEQDGLSMGTTAVALLMRRGKYLLAWAGDSRAYLLRQGDMRQLTSDHSQVQAMVDEGLIKAEDVANHPMAHVLTRVVGVAEEVEIASAAGPVEAGDVFLLSSDGLHGHVPEPAIAAALSENLPRSAVEQLIALALENGAPDNVTAVVILAAQHDDRRDNGAGAAQ